MGRYIYADQVGSAKDDTCVHKFWVAIQPSDVSDYLDTYEPQQFLADLSVDNEADIKEKIDELKADFEKQYGMAYEAFSDSISGGYQIDEQTPHNKLKLASRIDLGENLLETIENMKAAGISEQQLTIEF